MATIPRSQLCERCKLRYRQEGVLCRSCRRELGDHVGNFEREAEWVREKQERLDALRRPAPPARAPRTIIVNGVEYEVKWDGT